MNRNSKLNVPSANLTTKENELVFSLIGKKCQSQCTSVAKLYQIEAPYYRQWVKKFTGVLCFVNDKTKRSYYIRMFCLNNCVLVYEQEIYENMEFKRLKPYLISYEGQDGTYGLNFAFENEAELFFNISISKVERIRKRKKVVPQSSNSKEKTKVKKLEISAPSNFVHVTSFGDNAIILCDSIRQSLIKAGVSESQLNDEKTIKFINNFLEENKNPPPLPEKSPNINRKRPFLPLPPTSALASSTVMEISISSKISNVSVPPPPPPPPPSLQVICDIAKTENICEPLKREQATNPVISNSRDELLKQINQGVILKPVNKNVKDKSCKISSGNETDIMKTLLKALREREIKTRGSPDSDEERNSDWDERLS